MNKEQYEQNLFDRIILSMKKHGLESCATSVLLAGSFGRNEATYDYDKNGDVHLKSDVEIGVVYKSKKSVVDMISSVSSEFCEELNCMPLSEKRMRRMDNFNSAFIPSKKKTLFMYDLANGSKTIWGVDYVDKADVGIDDVDIYEAKRLVANRIGEMIYTQNTNNSDFMRWQAKLVSAIGSAYLLCSGGYMCSYHDQYNAVNSQKDKINNVLGANFCNKYNEAFKYLRQGLGSFDISIDTLRSYVRAIDGFFAGIGITKPMVNTSSRKLKYAIKYIKSTKKLNVIGLESRILDSLISEFVCNGNSLQHYAGLWHDVLY